MLVRLVLEERSQPSPDAEKIEMSSRRMHKLTYHHVTTPACCGAKHLSAAHKFRSVLHQLRIFCDCWQMVSDLIDLVKTCVTDLGLKGNFEQCLLTNRTSCSLNGTNECQKILMQILSLKKTWM